MARWFEFSIMGFFFHFIVFFLIYGILPDLDSPLYWDIIQWSVVLFWFVFFLKVSSRLAVLYLFAVYLTVSIAAPLAFFLFVVMMANQAHEINFAYFWDIVTQIGSMSLMVFGVFLVLILSGRWFVERRKRNTCA